MAITHVASAGANSPDGTSVTTAGIDTTGADFLVAAVSTTTNLTPTDSKSNTWTGLTVRTGGFGGKLRIWYVANPTVGSGHTLSVSGSGEQPSLSFAAFSGVATVSPFDVENGTSTATRPDVQPGSVTPSQDDSLIVTIAGVFCTAALSINGGYTKLTDNIGDPRWGNALAYLVQTSAAATNPMWSSPASAGDYVAAIAAFKPAGGGGGAGQPTMRRWGGMPYVGGQGIGHKGAGRMWGRSREGLIVPRRFAA